MPRLPEAAGALRRLRQHPAGSRRDDRQPALRDLHPPRVVLARLPGMRQPTQHRSRRCARCCLLQRLDELLRGGTGTIHPRLQALHDNLAGNDRPDTVLGWLNKNTAAALLRELAAGERPLTHAALDELPDSKTIRHLRSILVATGALASRDEHMARLERWITATIAGRDDPGERQLLHRYAIWHALRRLRRRAGGQHVTHGQAVTVQRHVRAAITLLDWLTARGLELATARQGDLDTWLTSDHATHHGEAGNFVRWARRQKLTSLDFAATRWDGPAGVIDTEARWHHARRLLHDDTVKPEDRVAGLLVLLYAQGPAAISRLTLDQFTPASSTCGSGSAASPSCCPAARRTRPPARRLPPRTRRTGRPGNLPLAVPRRAARPADQRLPHRRATAPARAPPRPGTLDRPIRPRHRTSRSPPGPTARHPHQRRRRLAASLLRRLDRLRRRLQPAPARPGRRR